MRRLSGLSPGAPVQMILHSVVITRHDLPSQPFGKVNHQRCFEIECQRTIGMTYDHEHLGTG